MKILHINSYYISRELYKNMYDYQAEQGHIISVFVPAQIGREPEDFERGNYTKISFDFREIDRYIFPLKAYKIYKDIERIYKITDYEIIHAHSLFSNGYIAYRLKRKYNIPYIVAVRNTDVNVFFKKLFYLRGLGNRILENADKVIFLSEAYKNNVIDKYVYKKDIVGNKSVVIPNGIDRFWLSNRKKVGRAAPEKNHLNIISVGTIDKNKNFLISRRVVETLKMNGFDVHWTVIGKIIDDEVKKYITSCPLAEYKMPMKKQELIREYETNDVFLLPSINETFGLVYAEALTQGVPVIYTRGQGFDKQFPDGIVGFPVDCFNIQEICDRIVSIMNNYETFSQNCVLGCTQFDWTTISNSYLEIYGSMFLC